MRETVATASLYGSQGVGEANAPDYEAQDMVQYLTSIEQLSDYSKQITGLAARALQPNILFEPTLLNATWHNFFAQDDSARIILIWKKSVGADRQLIALLPMVSDTRTWFGVPLATGFRNDMKFLGTPLIDHDHADEALDELLAAMSKTAPFPSAWLFDEMPAQGAFAEAFTAALERAGWLARSFDKSQRVLLDASRPSDEYLAEALSSKKRKEYRRQANRLKDMGELQFEMVSESGTIGEALEELFQLERQGWKGANHTAILDREAWTGFFRDGMAGVANSGQASVARLLLDGKAIAAALVLTAGDAAWFYKIAYREDLAQYSPGVQLTLELTKHLCGRPDICKVDSCTRDDHPMITHIWREREAYHDLLVVPPDSPAGVIFCAETTRRGAREILKKGYHGIKRKMRGK